jgi:phosphate starvation-inducible PhoH-like protein
MADEALLVEAKPTEELSSKATRRAKRKADKMVRATKRNPKPIEARTYNQSLYITSLTENELTFSCGPAGVGKTYIPSRVYGGMLASGQIKKLYLARPNVAKKKHQNGFLPGTLEDKTAPWLIPIMEGIKDSMSPSEFDRFRREKMIEEVPYEFMQGRTFSDAACIIDEAENLDMDDLYITLTRQGDNLNMAVCGDINQARIPDSGLAYVVEMAKLPFMQSVGVVEFTEEDVVRSRQAAQWVKAFNRVRLSETANCGKQEGNGFGEQHAPSFLKVS